METVQIIIFWVLLIDSVTVNAIAWFGRRWFYMNFQMLSRHLPMTRGWAALYLVLVLYIGYLTLAG